MALATASHSRRMLACSSPRPHVAARVGPPPPRRLPAEHVALELAKERAGRGGHRIDEAIVVVEAGDGVEGAHVIASRAAPELERGRVAAVDVLPEALARGERVDDDIDDASEAPEELVEGAGHVREAEDVNRGRQELGPRLQRRHRLVERDDPRRP
jgi:hypothetical protein